MTTIYEKIKTDFIAARKAKQAGVVALLSTVIGEMNNEASRAKTGDKTVSDEIAIKVLKSFAKNLEEVFKISGSVESEIELDIINTYLPSQMTGDDLRIVLKNFVDVTGKNSMKDIMNFLKEQFAGLYDGKVASTIAKEFA